MNSCDRVLDHSSYVPQLALYLAGAVHVLLLGVAIVGQHGRARQTFITTCLVELEFLDEPLARELRDVPECIRNPEPWPAA